MRIALLLLPIAACWRAEPPPPPTRPSVTTKPVASEAWKRQLRALELASELRSGVAMKRVLTSLQRGEQQVWVIDQHAPLGALIEKRAAVVRMLVWAKLLRDPGRTEVQCRFFATAFQCFQTASPFQREPLLVMRFCADERLESVMVDDGSFPLPGADTVPTRCP